MEVVLSDHHFWGGLRRSQTLAGIAETFGLGLSMHSNSHLGISLAAMVHLAAATPNLTYACDTHWPWKTRGRGRSASPVPWRSATARCACRPRPGSAWNWTADALDRLHEQYLAAASRERDDTGYMRRIQPGYELKSPRW